MITRSEIARAIHNTATHRFGECDHGSYAGEPYAACEFYADTMMTILPGVRAEALRQAAAKWQTGDWANYIPSRDAIRPEIILGMAQGAADWLRARASQEEAVDV